MLLGVQRFHPTVAEVAGGLGLEGPYATVTAGWQEMEAEDKDLDVHLGGDTVNLRLYERAEDVFQRDTELFEAHRKRQEALQHRQDFYRIRLEHELEAAHVIRTRSAPPEILAEEETASLAAIRDLDRWHLGECQRIREAFDAEWSPLERPAVAEHRDALREALTGCRAVAIAGGHVATLLNRLDLFGAAELLHGLPIVAWTAGAMAVSERVVLFHDSPPQGPGAAEVLDRGLGLVPGIVALPQPEMRLRTDDPERVSVMARRFAPALCVALPSRGHVVVRKGRIESASGATVLSEDGSTRGAVEDVAA